MKKKKAENSNNKLLIEALTAQMEKIMDTKFEAFRQEVKELKRASHRKEQEKSPQKERNPRRESVTDMDAFKAELEQILNKFCPFSKKVQNRTKTRVNKEYTSTEEEPAAANFAKEHKQSLGTEATKDNNTKKEEEASDSKPISYQKEVPPIRNELLEAEKLLSDENQNQKQAADTTHPMLLEKIKPEAPTQHHMSSSVQEEEKSAEKAQESLPLITNLEQPTSLVQDKVDLRSNPFQDGGDDVILISNGMDFEPKLEEKGNRFVAEEAVPCEAKFEPARRRHKPKPPWILIKTRSEHSKFDPRA